MQLTLLDLSFPVTFLFQHLTLSVLQFFACLEILRSSPGFCTMLAYIADVNVPVGSSTPVHMIRSRSDIDLSGVKAKVDCGRPRASTQLGLHRLEKGNTASLRKHR